jgi:hypothetical protein
MKMSPALILLSVALLQSHCPPVALAQAEPKATASPFDKDDPEIQKLKQLNWKDIDFNGQDIKTRCEAFLAMQDVLSMAGGKASARVELLIDYVDQEKLGEMFVDSQEAITLPSLITYEDAKKISMAFVKSNVGRDKFGDELEGIDDATLKAYQTMYANSSRRAFEECIEARYRVRSMALFLESTGRLEQFKTWSKAEMKRKQAARDEEVAKLRDASKEAEKARQEHVLAKRKEAEQRAAAQMEAYLQSQQQPAAGGQTVIVQSDDDWDGDTWMPWTGAYYASDAYRGYVRDKFQDRWQNWNGGGGGAQPKARRARGRR